MKNNKKLETLIDLKIKYKIPILILLTDFDNYCDEIKKTEPDWKNICSESLAKNKEDLLDYINNVIIKKRNLEFNEDDILHIVLVKPKLITDDDIIKTFDENLKKDYDNSNEEEKKKMLKIIKFGMNMKDNEVQDFLKEMNIYGKKELIEKLKGKLPHQYHNAFAELE